MSAGRHLTLVTERDESLRAFEAFKSAFAAGADLFRDHVVGFPSGSWRVDVHWHGAAGIWGLFVSQPRDHQSKKPLDRFSSGFGVADPNQHSSLSITVEINPPQEGENPRTAGVFLRDESERLYVGHGGRVGGGRPGIGQRAFREFAQDLPWQEIATPRGRLRDVVVFGPFQDPAMLLDRLARYVHTVARFKDSYLRSVVFPPVLARVRRRAESLREVKQFPRTAVESYPDNFVEVWRYIDWLDRAYYARLPKDALIPGPVFERLDPDKKVLAHWLTYIMDAQMDARRLWTFGGPVVAELVEAYSTSRNPIAALTKFSVEPRQSGKVATLAAKRQKADGERLKITPRYSSMLFSLATTLVTLGRYKRSLTVYLARNRGFLSCEPKDIPERIAFLLYLLSYREVPKVSDPPGTRSFGDIVERHSSETLGILAARNALETEFEAWAKSDKRFHKRLWAALRDYVKQGSEFHEYFRSALNRNGLSELADHIDDLQGVILPGLEVPGDVWNLLFFDRVFGGPATSGQIGSRRLRSWMDELKNDGGLPPDAAIERFDISFRYTPRMCDEGRERCCLLRAESDIWEHCPPRRGIDWKGQPCPVTDHLCGIEYFCDPGSCPVLHARPKDLCPGCVRITEQHV
jgi:hypothetical protein